LIKKFECVAHSQQQTQAKFYMVFEVFWVSTKGICVVIDASTDHTHVNISNLHEFYAKDDLVSNNN